MRFFTILLLVLVNNAFQDIYINTQADQNYPTFDQYLKNFNKSYSKQQRWKRQKIYYQNLNIIKKHNQMPDKTYQLGVNQFTDMKQQQFTSSKDVMPEKQQSILEAQKNTLQLRQKMKTQKRLLIQESLNYNDKGFVTSIKNQGSCGSCWAFAATAAYESFALVHGYLDPNFSQQLPLKCTAGSDCSGGYTEDAFKVYVTIGGVTRDQYPYQPYKNDISLCYTAEKYIKLAKQQFTYRRLNDDQIIKLLQDSPVTTSVSTSGWAYYKSGVFSCSSSLTNTDHVVLIVGYTPTYWIVKNSWGTSWGQRGYMYIVRSGSYSSKSCLVGSKVNQFVKYLRQYFLKLFILAYVLLISMIF